MSSDAAFFFGYFCGAFPYLLALWMHKPAERDEHDA